MLTNEVQSAALNVVWKWHVKHRGSFMFQLGKRLQQWCPNPHLCISLILMLLADMQLKIVWAFYT